MDRKQLINCTVTNCAYNNNEEKKCELQSIQVAAMNNSKTTEADESMCASFECDNECN